MHFFPFTMLMPLVIIAVMVLIFIRVMDYLKLKATISGDGTERERPLEEIQSRLDEIERRLTDVQDVMIALSEKFDRWEQETAALNKDI